MDFLMVLFELIMQSINNDGREAVKARLKQAGPGVRFRAYRAAVKAGHSRRDAMDIARDCCADLRAASDEDLEALIDEATA